MHYYVLLKGFWFSNSLKCPISRYFLFADILKLFCNLNLFHVYISNIFTLMVNQTNIPLH